MITHNPLHGSGRAALPHPDLALGEDAHAAQGIGMTDGRQRQPASDEAPHAICFVGFGTDRLRRKEAMKTAGRENPNHGVALPRNRAHGAEGQNKSCLFKWAAKQEKFQPKEVRFSLTSTFIELPMPVRHRRTSLDFPMRPTATAALGGLGISRFPCEVSPYVHGVSDRAGLWYTSRYRCTRCCLPLSPTASASRRKCFTRLNTRPARSPVNASTPPSRAAPLTRGRYGSLIHFRMTFSFTTTSPV